MKGTYAKGRVHEAVRRVCLCNVVKSLDIGRIKLDQLHVLLNTRWRYGLGDNRASTSNYFLESVSALIGGEEE